MLVVDAARVQAVGSRRFESVLGEELREGRNGKVHFASKENKSLVANMRATLAHSLKLKESNNDNVGKLKEYSSIISEIEVDHEIDITFETTSAEVTSAAATTEKRGGSHNVSQSNDNNKNGSIEAEDVSGERIQYLLQDQKDLNAKDLEIEQRAQAMLVNELSELTGMLKETTLEINRAVKVQNVQLTAMAGYAADNRDELESQKKRMKESTAVMGTSLWSTVWLIVWVLLMFGGAYAVIRLFPAPLSSSGTCPANPPQLPSFSSIPAIPATTVYQESYGTEEEL